MATALLNESDIVTCSVCFYEFDEVGHCPKLLPCSHTICLTCLKGIIKKKCCVCPLCRTACSYSGNVSRLPTNNSILHILKLNRQLTALTLNESTSLRFCLQCFSAKRQDVCCPFSHPYVEMTIASFKGIEALVLLKTEWLKRKEIEQTELNHAIKQTKDVHKWLSRVSQMLALYGQSIATVQADNGRIQENLNAIKSGQSLEEMSDLLSFINNSGVSADDTSKTLKLKLGEVIDSKLYDVAQAERYWNFYVLPHKKTIKITLSLSDEKHCTVEGIFSNNLSTDDAESIAERDSFLMGHLAHSIYKKETRKKLIGEPLVANESGIWRKFIRSASAKKNKTSTRVGFVMGLSKFVVVLENDYSSDHKNYWASEEIYVQSPSSSLYSRFIKELGNWCYRQHGYQPTIYSKSITQAVAGPGNLSYFMADMPQPSDSAMPIIFGSSMNAQSKEDIDLMEIFGGVGVSIQSKGIGRWNLALPLFNFDFPQKPATGINVSRTMPLTFLLGRISRWKDMDILMDAMKRKIETKCEIRIKMYSC